MGKMQIREKNNGTNFFGEADYIAHLASILHAKILDEKNAEKQAQMKNEWLSLFIPTYRAAVWEDELDTSKIIKRISFRDFSIALHTCDMTFSDLSAQMGKKVEYPYPDFFEIVVNLTNWQLEDSKRLAEKFYPEWAKEIDKKHFRVNNRFVAYLQKFDNKNTYEITLNEKDTETWTDLKHDYVFDVYGNYSLSLTKLPFVSHASGLSIHWLTTGRKEEDIPIYSKNHAIDRILDIYSVITTADKRRLKAAIQKRVQDQALKRFPPSYRETVVLDGARLKDGENIREFFDNFNFDAIEESFSTVVEKNIKKICDTEVKAFIAEDMRRRAPIDSEMRQKTTKLLKDYGKTFGEYAKEFGMNPSTFTRLFSLKEKSSKGRMFSLTNQGYIVLTRKYIETSCDKYLFGNARKASTRLPRHLSVLAEYMDELSPALQMQLVAYAADFPHITDRGDAAEYRPDIIVERMDELREDLGISPYCLGGNPSLSVFGQRLRFYRTGINQSLKIDALMYIAYKNNTTVDYFLVDDYTDYTDIRLCWSNESITNKNIIAFISHYLRLSKEDQIEVYAYAIAQCLVSKTKKIE